MRMIRRGLWVGAAAISAVVSARVTVSAAEAVIALPPATAVATEGFASTLTFDVADVAAGVVADVSVVYGTASDSDVSELQPTIACDTVLEASCEGSFRFVPAGDATVEAAETLTVVFTARPGYVFAGGGSVASTVFSIVDPPAKPASPALLTASVNSTGTVSVSWRDRSRNEDGFAVEVRLPGPGTSWTGIDFGASAPANGTSTSFLLGSEGRFALRVCAVNLGGEGCSGWSANLSWGGPPAGSVGWVRVVPVYRGVSLVTWGGLPSGVVGYQVQYRYRFGDGSTSGWTTLGFQHYGTGLVHMATDRVQYRVRGYNGQGETPYTMTSWLMPPPG